MLRPSCGKPERHNIELARTHRRLSTSTYSKVLRTMYQRTDTRARWRVFGANGTQLWQHLLRALLQLFAGGHYRSYVCTSGWLRLKLFLSNSSILHRRKRLTRRQLKATSWASEQGVHQTVIPQSEPRNQLIRKPGRRRSID
jgi:hypothetical protein